MATPKTVKLKTSDEETLTVNVEVARRSLLIRNILDKLCFNEERAVTLPKVNSSTLKKVIEWCTYHKDDPPRPEENDINYEMSYWDTEFLKVDRFTLYELVLAAKYLDVKDLLHASCHSVRNMIMGKTPAEIRANFGFDSSSEEEEDIREES